jgi:hypothetical protein
VSLFPWNLASLHSFKESESYPPEFKEGWPKFIETYAGWIVVGSTEELYLIRSLRAGGKQEKQIRLDTVSAPTKAQKQTQQPRVGNPPYHCRGLGSESDLLLESSTCDCDVKCGLRV